MAILATPLAPVEADHFTSSDGLALAGWHHRLASCRSRVVFVHGFAEHSDRYGDVVRALLAAGHECHLFDLRGHGDSAGQRGHVGAISEYEDDLAAALARVADGPGGTPTVLLAHSLGGLIALSALLHRPLPVDALVCSSPFLAAGFPVSALKKATLRWCRRLLPHLSIPAGLDPAGLSHDPDVVARYLADPRIVRTVTLGWAGAVLEAQEEVFERAPAIRLPVLFLLGEEDPVADPTRGRAVFDRLSSEDKTLRIYPGFRHEVLNELGRERVFADVAAWLRERFSLPAAVR